MSKNGLPPGWERATLEDVTVPKRSVAKPADFPSLPYVGMEHVESETMRLLGTVPAGTLRSNALRFSPGDVLYGRLRPYLNKVLQPTFEGLCSAEFIVFPESHALDPNYLRYFLNSWRFKRFASGLNAGDRPRVDWNQLKSHPLPIPPLLEQRRIVAAIEEQFARLDAGVAALERTRINLKRYRASVLKAAVEGRLTERWREEHPDVEDAKTLLQRILEERRARWEEDQLARYDAKGQNPPKNWRSKYKEPVAPDSRDLSVLPEGWTQATVSQLNRFVRYGSSAKTSNDPSGVPFLRMGNIIEGSLDTKKLKYLPVDHSEFPELLLKVGDLLFNRTNSAELVGKSAVYKGTPDPCSYASYLIGVRLADKCLSDYVSYFLNSSHGRAWVASIVSQQVGQANVNGTKLQALTLPLPPLAEQEEIVAEVERRLSVAEGVEAQVQAGLKRAARLRQAILKRAFEGRLVPQDPADEPAEALLERIRAERAANAKPKRKGRSRTPRPARTGGAQPELF